VLIPLSKGKPTLVKAALNKVTPSGGMSSSSVLLFFARDWFIHSMNVADEDISFSDFK
jgi:hypothetical protein